MWRYLLTGEWLFNGVVVEMSSVMIIVPNLPDEYHLEYVAKEMNRLGPPRIRAIYSKEQRAWFAAEGSHRIAAAHRSGIIPVVLDITGQGATVQREEVDTTMTAEELEAWLTSDLSAPRYVFRMIDIDEEWNT